MATEAPACPECKANLGTPLNEECGGRRCDGPGNSNLRCPACGHGWLGTDLDVANAWRSFVEWEQKETSGLAVTIGVAVELNPAQRTACRCEHSMAAHDQSMAAPGRCHAGDCRCEAFVRAETQGETRGERP